MKILYLSDFNCPYSYIGLKRMKDVCCEMDLNVKWEMKAFELEPNADNLKAIDRFAIKNRLSISDAACEIENIEKIAKEDGLNINYKDMVINSSKDAHRLVMYLQDKYPEVSQNLVFKIFESNFIKNEDISNHDVLINLSASCGLDKEEINHFLKSDSLTIEIYLDMDEAISNGITTIPYYFLEYYNERLIVPGVYEKESIRTAFKDLINGEIRNKTFI